MGKREPQIILKTEERSIHLELGRDGKFAAKSSGWDENRVSLRATSSKSQSRTACRSGELLLKPRRGSVLGGICW